MYKRHKLILLAIFFVSGAHFAPMTYDRSGRLNARGLVRHVRKIDPIQSNIEILRNVDFAQIFRDLHQYLSPDEVRMVTTLGLVAGALRAEESMREHLYVLTDDLIASFASKKPKESMDKLIFIEETINRDKSMVEVLDEMLSYARNESTLDILQSEMYNILKEVSRCFLC